MIHLSSKAPGFLTPSTIDPVLKLHKASIKAFSYATFDITRIAQSGVNSASMSDRARIEEVSVGLYGVMPSQFDSTYKQFLVTN